MKNIVIGKMLNFMISAIVKVLVLILWFSF